MHSYEWPRPAMTADVVLFSPEKSHILCVQRSKDPYKGFWALPGGFLNPNSETLVEAAQRELFEETAIAVPCNDLSFVKLFDAIDRDKRGRVISSCFTAVLSKYRMPTAGDDAAKAEWIMLERVLSGEIVLAFDHWDMLKASLHVSCRS